MIRPRHAASPFVLLLLAACGGDPSTGENVSTEASTASTGTGRPAASSSSGEGGAGGEGGGGGFGASAACPTGVGVDTSAMLFDGDADYITMGPAPELGLAKFTIEAWVRRDRVGAVASTGVGGLTLVPIAGKGRGESDGSNVDCNYTFGFVGDVLAADFEDAATGANHPVVGKIGVPLGTWHHVAATYDGTTWRLYVDGVKDTELAANATPRADSIQHFGIGAAFNSTGVAAGGFAGAIDEVRVWDHARADAEIAAGVYTTIPTATGLVGRWALDATDGGAPNTAGGSPGVVVGATFTSPGAVLDAGAPPTLEGAAPADGAEVTATGAKLSVAVDDPEGSATRVTFHLREVTDDDDFTIVVYPDTQYYTRDGDDHDFFYTQTQWVVDHRVDYNIVAVIHNGDIVDKATIASQWVVADKAMKTLETPIGALPDGMPYGVGVGNHDQAPNGVADGTADYNERFGIARFEGRSYYGGHYGSDNDESWYTFAAGGRDFVVVNLQYNTSPDPAVLAWGRSIFESHPDAYGILNSHYILTGSGNFSAQGQAIYDELKDVENVHLMTCGHVTAEQHRSDTSGGHVIHSMLADYQGRDLGGAGYMRIWEFSPKNAELTVRSYSPKLDKWETDADSEFTLDVDLAGIGGAFAQAGVVDPAASGSTAKVELAGLQPGHAYEWYATVTDCAHVVDGAVHRFTTAN